MKDHGDDLLRSGLDSIRERITVIDREGYIIYANRAYCELLRRECGDSVFPIIGKKLVDLRPRAKLPAIIDTGRSNAYILRL